MNTRRVILKTVRNNPAGQQPPGLFLTEYSGRCTACSEPITEGDWVSKSRVKGVSKSRGKGMVHPKCIGIDRENSLG